MLMAWLSQTVRFAQAMEWMEHPGKMVPAKHRMASLANRDKTAARTVISFAIHARNLFLDLVVRLSALTGEVTEGSPVMKTKMEARVFEAMGLEAAAEPVEASNLAVRMDRPAQRVLTVATATAARQYTLVS
jgi:hypothetical protein